jgi:hypothetical protein
MEVSVVLAEFVVRLLHVCKNGGCFRARKVHSWAFAWSGVSLSTRADYSRATGGRTNCGTTPTNRWQGIRCPAHPDVADGRGGPECPHGRRRASCAFRTVHAPGPHRVGASGALAWRGRLHLRLVRVGGCEARAGLRGARGSGSRHLLPVRARIQFVVLCAAQRELLLARIYYCAGVPAGASANPCSLLDKTVLNGFRSLLTHVHARVRTQVAATAPARRCPVHVSSAVAPLCPRAPVDICAERGHACLFLLLLLVTVHCVCLDGSHGARPGTSAWQACAPSTGVAASWPTTWDWAKRCSQLL